MKNLFFGILLCIGVTSLQAQYEISGNVTNEYAEPVGFASVTLYDALTNKTKTFKNTNSKGDFKLTVKEPGSYILKIRNMKFETYEEEIQITEDTKEYNFEFELTSKENQLDEVISVARSAVAVINGDTITFKIDRFTDKSERTLGDIIDKLPGMEIDGNGDILANGEKVDKLLVDGEEIFSDSQKLLTQNLTSKAVKDIQLLTDFKEDGKLDDFNGEKKTAVNVQLKEEYKGKITGDISVAAGIEDKYDIHTNLFRFNKKGNISFIADIQNTGESAFSFEDYIGFLGGFSEFSGGGRGSRRGLRFGNDPITNLIFQGNNVEDRQNQIAALNINQSLSKKFKVKFMSIFSNLEQNSFSQTFRNYFDGNVENNRESNNGKSFFNSNRLTLKYQPSDTVLLEYKASANFSRNRNTLNIFSNLNNLEQNFSNETNGDPWSLAQNLKYEFKPSKRTLIEIGASYEHSFSPNNDLINSDQTFLNLGTNSEGRYDTNYIKDNTENSFNGHASLKYSKKKLIYKAEVGTNISKYNLDTKWLQYLNNGVVNVNPTNFENELELKKRDVYTELSLSRNKGFWQYELGTVLKYYSIDVKDEDNSFDRFSVLPFAELSANFSTASVLSLSYSYSENFPEVNNYLPVNKYLINNYRSLDTLNAISTERFFPSHSLNLNYRYFNRFSGFSFFGGVNYSHQDESLAKSSEFSLDYNRLFSIIAPYNESYGANFFIRKKFDFLPISARLGSRYSISNGFSFISDNAFKRKTNSFSSNLSIKTEMKPIFNIEVGLNFSESKFEVDSNPNTTINTSRNPFVEIRGALVETGIKWEARYTYQNTNDITYDDLNFEISFDPKGSSWSFGIIGDNMLNFSQQEQSSISQNTLYTSESINRILPGYILGVIKYKF